MKKTGTIAVLNLEGTISGGSSSYNNINPIDVYNSVQKLKKMRNVDGCIIRINSPGGSAPASEEVMYMIQHGIRIPKFGSIGDIACSGGYMIATACDKIYTNYSSFVGSIGVIMTIPQLQEIFNKLEYSEILLKVGKFKDICSTRREMTPEECDMISNLMEHTYKNFTSIVKKNRNLNDDEMSKISEGRIFIGGNAVENKMVDYIGGYNICIRGLATYLNLDSFKIIEVNKASRWSKFLSRLSFGEIFNQFDFNNRMKDFTMK